MVTKKISALIVRRIGTVYALPPNMPFLSCPNCGDMTPRELEASSLAPVNFYRCGNCAHVWTTDKSTHAIVAHITPLGKTTEKKPD